MSMTRNEVLSQLAHGIRKFDGMSAAQLLESGWMPLNNLTTQDAAFFKARADQQAQSVAQACQNRTYNQQ